MIYGKSYIWEIWFFNTLWAFPSLIVTGFRITMISQLETRRTYVGGGCVGLKFSYGHHLGCLNNALFLILGLCAACWAHFTCHHELWPISVSHTFSFLNSSCWRKTLPENYCAYLYSCSSKFVIPGYFPYILFCCYLFSLLSSAWVVIAICDSFQSRELVNSMWGKIMIPMYHSLTHAKNIFSQATSHYLSHCWPRSMSLYGLIRSQSVNGSILIVNWLITINIIWTWLELCVSSMSFLAQKNVKPHQSICQHLHIL